MKGQTVIETNKREVHNRGMAAKVYEFLVANPDRVVTRQELVQEFGLTNTQVQTSMYHIVNRMAPGYVEKLSSVSWRYNPNAKPESNSARYFEQVAEIGNGTYILRDDEGNAYSARLKQIDLP